MQNPFRPGAGHYPPFLAGRGKEIERCKVLFEQSSILHNIVITGLRGVGKTVLLSTLQPIAIKYGWMWCGTDMSESASISEETIALRLLTDLAVPLSMVTARPRYGFIDLEKIYQKTPGLVSDKLKAVLTFTWRLLKNNGGFHGIIFAYDEVQTMQDHAKENQYPLSLLLDVFQSIQRQDVPFMLVLAGLPTLHPRLVATRTYAERMFEVIFLERLNAKDSRTAIEQPIKKLRSPIYLTKDSIDTIIQLSGGYPYFIQFICREVFDIVVRNINLNKSVPPVPANDILRKLDCEFFAGRWANLTDRQRELLRVVASLETLGSEFTVQEVVQRSQEDLTKPFSASQIAQMFAIIANKGILYKNRHGKYSFAVPLFDQFITRQNN